MKKENSDKRDDNSNKDCYLFCFKESNYNYETKEH